MSFFLTAEHISDFRIRYDSDKRVLTEHHQEKLAKIVIELNDLLITIKGKTVNAAYFTTNFCRPKQFKRFTKTKNCVRLSYYGDVMQRKVFWISFMMIGLLADIILPLMWGFIATVPILFLSWWIAYKSEWFE